ncbi:hypothetical protein F4808DRAFT_469281 [Astrocystis sublimbata]|nr:hypothetical protein F4808DRAFT_469281 [Astrocystis sublimbata]
MAPRTPKLAELMFQGFHSGLRWQTKGHATYDGNEGCIVHTHRFLLHHAHSTHLAKMIFKHLGTKKRGIVADCLADIYNYAVDHARLCDMMQPRNFWASAKNSWDWSANINDDAFCAFTYKLLHARNLYLATVPEGARPPRNALVKALDDFMLGFNICFPRNQELKDAYMPYTEVDSEGDGTDKAFSQVVQDMDTDPNDEKFAIIIPIPMEFTEDLEDIYVELGDDSPRFAHNPMFHDIDEALRMAVEANERSRVAQMKYTGLETEMAMIDIQEDVDDVDMGGL